MGSELTPNWRNNKSIIVILFVVFITCILWRAVSANRNYPYLVGEQWICAEPYFTLSYVMDDSNSINSTETIIFDNKVIEVEIGFLMNEYCVYPRGSSAYDDRLLVGTWKYDKGNLVFLIDEDFIFNKQYSKLVFSPKKEE